MKRGDASEYRAADRADYADGRAWRPARPWTPLALTLGLHLLLVLAWFGAGQADMRGGLRREPPPRVSVFVPVQPLSPPRPQALPDTPPSPRQLRRPARTAPAPPAPDVPSITVQAPVPAPAPVDADTAAVPQEPASTALPGDLLTTSKAMAGRIDRALRKGASPITAEPERKWERFAEAVAGARTGATRVVTLDSYTSPDGVIIYRKTVGNRVACYRSGSVGGLVTGFGSADGQGAGSTDCPSGVRWTRH